MLTFRQYSRLHGIKIQYTSISGGIASEYCGEIA